MNEQWFLEAEQFEYQPEADFEESYSSEYETPPEPCPNYAAGEVQKSRTEAGHLPADVIRRPDGLLIADFGVDWRTPRESLKSNPVLLDWLKDAKAAALAYPNTLIMILGFSDCVGNEANNTFLRKGRASRVLQLLDRMIGGAAWWNNLKAKGMVIADAADPGQYVETNATVVGRASNRGVLITLNTSPVIVKDPPTAGARRPPLRRR